MKFRAIVFLLLLLNLQDTFGQKKAPQPDLIDTAVYKVVDVYPVSIIHGKEVDFEEVNKFVQANLTWPKTPGCIEGSVLISLIVEKDGSVTNKKVLKSLFPKFDEEAMRVIDLLSTWKPGIQKGKEVRTLVILPVRFKIN